MSADRRIPSDADGVRISRGRSAAARILGIVLVASALAVVAVSAGAVWWLRRDAGPGVAHEPAASPDLAVAQAPSSTTDASVTHAAQDRAAPARLRAVPRREPEAGAAAPASAPSPTRDARAAARPAAGAGTSPADRTNGGPTEADDAAAARADREVARTAEEVIAGMRAAGETRGLAAIPPSGTNPVKPGLVVPKDFELPEGYIRHYQTTDDGRRLEAILMFSPDYDFVDEHGNRVAVPDDGIVQPDMAPPGMPLRTLDVPASEAPRRSSSGSGNR